MGTESQRPPCQEDRNFGFEMWNGCASRTTSSNRNKMCNQDNPWRSSEEEEAHQKGWSGDEEESSPGTTGKSAASFCMILSVAPTLAMLHERTMSECSDVLGVDGHR
jgi:hypothetical protein